MPISLVTGASGFLGRKLCSLLTAKNHQVFPVNHSEYELTRYESTYNAINNCIKKYDKRPDFVFHLAAKVSGIGGIQAKPAEYFMDNMLMGLNVIQATKALAPSTHLIVAGSVCAYPQNAPIPMAEEYLWMGEPEPTNGPYGIAKRTISAALQAYYDQYRLRSTYILMANLYGPGDNFDFITSHAIPAIIMKTDTAIRNDILLEVWGDGKASRDFLYVNDAANAFYEATFAPGKAEVINVGSGVETTIAHAVRVICDVMGYNKEVMWNTSKPSGQSRRCLSLWKTKQFLDWEPLFPFKSGIANTCDYYVNEVKPYESL